MVREEWEPAFWNCPGRAPSSWETVLLAPRGRGVPVAALFENLEDGVARIAAAADGVLAAIGAAAPGATPKCRFLKGRPALIQT